VRYPQPRYKSEADKKNWLAVQVTMKTFTDNEQKNLQEVYSGGGTLADNVYRLAKRLHTNQDTIWHLIEKAERSVAKRRGLI
jgi:hypothetical protein